MRHLVLLAPLALLGAVPAQVNHTLPPIFDRIWGGNNGTGTAYGGTKGISQNLYENWLNNPSFVFGIGFRRTATTADYPAFSLDFEIVLSETTATWATLSSTFAANLGTNVTAVLPRQIINIPAKDKNTPPQDFISFPITTPWFYQGPALLIQTKAFAAVWASTWFRPDRTFASATSGEAINWGGNCGSATITSTATGSYLSGSGFSVTLGGAPSTQPSVLMLGTDLTVYGGLPLPLDLTLVNMPGCLLHVAPLLSFNALTDAAGAANLNFSIPAGTPSFPLAFEWFYGDPTAPRPVTVSGTNGRYMPSGLRSTTHPDRTRARPRSLLVAMSELTYGRRLCSAPKSPWSGYTAKSRRRPSARSLASRPECSCAVSSVASLFPCLTRAPCRRSARAAMSCACATATRTDASSTASIPTRSLSSKCLQRRPK